MKRELLAVKRSADAAAAAWAAAMIRGDADAASHHLTVMRAQLARADELREEMDREGGGDS